jgi:1,4-dihydroxy-2-naphthoate octaprenyltransferase
MKNTQKLTGIKKWWICIRPFSLPASTMPVIFGTVLAVVYGNADFKPLFFLLSIVAMVILHGASNILSDVHDFKRGLDTVATPVSGGVVRGLISLEEARKASLLLFGIGLVMGLVLAWFTGWMLLVIGLVGLTIGIFYTTGSRINLKYNALGDLAVFMNFGILGALGSWYVQTTEMSWVPVLWSVPMATLVIAILHANNWRDIRSDTSGRIITMASLLGDKRSLRYYAVLIYGPFVMVLSLILVPHFLLPEYTAMPFTFLMTLAALPLTFKLWRIALRRKDPRHPMDFITLDGRTARLNLVFGLLCTAALLLDLAVANLL